VNFNQVRSVIRALVPAILAFAVGRGWMGQEAAADVMAAVVALGAALWGAFENQPKQLVAKVAADPNVNQVVVKDPAVAAAMGDKVVSDTPPSS
jgi:hypothetical protein